MDTAELRKFLTMEDHPGDVALLDAIERAADELDRLRAENKALNEMLDYEKKEAARAVKALMDKLANAPPGKEE